VKGEGEAESNAGEEVGRDAKAGRGRGTKRRVATGSVESTVLGKGWKFAQA